MQVLSRANIECIGNRIVQIYKQKHNMNNQKLLKVQIEQLVTEVLNLNISYHHLSLDNSVLGVTTSFSGIEYKIFDEEDEEDFYCFDGKSLLIESDLKKDISLMGRKNFTIAHEASHQILNRLFPNEYTGGFRKLHFSYAHPIKKNNTIDWEEWQANTLASVILMPYETLKEDMLLFGLGTKIQRLNRVFEARVYEKFSNMASCLGVSKHALSIRMKHLGLIKEDYFDNPYKLVDVFYEEG